MAIKLTSTDIDKQYYLKKHDRTMQLKLHIPNLYLWITKSGKCTFRYKTYLQGNFTWVTLGHHPALTVNAAVALAYEMKTKRDAGINPNEEKRDKASKNILLSEYINTYLKESTKPHAVSTQKAETYLFGIIIGKLGAIKLQDITATIIKNKLLNDYLTDNKLAMANRLRVKLNQLFNHALKQELLIKNPASNLDAYYTPKNAQANNLHLTAKDLQQFINDLYHSDIKTSVKYYVHLAIILGVRKSELYNATWDMIDFDSAIFNNYQLKTSKVNKIPLSHQAVKLLAKLKKATKGKYIMTGNVLDKPVSKNYFNEVLDKLEYNRTRERAERISPHDFRRVLSTLANEAELFAPIDVEMALGHETRSGVERHYNNATVYLSRKKAVFDWIADKVDGLINPELDIYNLLVVIC